MERLTDIKLKALAKAAKKGEEKPRDIREGNGFGVSILPSGSLSFFLFYTFAGRKKRIRFGIYDPPAYTLADARNDADEARALLAQGSDPAVKRSTERNAAKLADEQERKEPTLAALLTEFWERELKDKKTGAEMRRMLEKDMLPAWGKRKVRDITRRDVVVLLDAVRDRGAVVLANRLHGRLTRLFNFACERGVIQDSPCIRLRKTTEQPRERALCDVEIKWIWPNLNSASMDTGTALALRLILLTGQRPGEVAGMAWTEIDESAAVWTIPPSRSKNGKEHVVPLTQLALDLLEQARQIACNSNYVFPSPRLKNDRPIEVRSMSRAVKRWLDAVNEGSVEDDQLELWTPHDLRRTVRTKLAELGIDDVVAERVLNHTIQGIARVYNRHHYTAEKRAALGTWDKRLRELVGETRSTSNIFPIPLQSRA